LRRTGRIVLPIAAILAVAVPGAAGGGVSPKNGQYAGGAGNVAVWFQVSGGAVTNGLVRARFPTCQHTFPVINTSDIPDGKGRFGITRSDGGDTVTIKGRFRSRTRATGKVIWSQNDACPAGTYKFDYTVKRFRIPG
jgi:hypothetical protein